MTPEIKSQTILHVRGSVPGTTKLLWAPADVLTYFTLSVERDHGLEVAETLETAARLLREQVHGGT